LTLNLLGSARKNSDLCHVWFVTFDNSPIQIKGVDGGNYTVPTVDKVRAGEFGERES
jgi:hypothetical protein